MFNEIKFELFRQINGVQTYQAVLDKIEKVKKNNGIINGVFEPSKDGYLGDGIFSVTYKGSIHHINALKNESIFNYIQTYYTGTMIPFEKEVAMKFTDASQKFASENAAREYAIYSYLNAIHNIDSNIEIYGIPSVYYYGRWEGYILMALTLLDTTVESKFKSNEINVLDILIIFREFVSRAQSE